MSRDPSSKPEAPQQFYPASRATAPAALEQTSESAWQRFEEMLQRTNETNQPAVPATGYAPTEPMQLAGIGPKAAVEPPRAVSLEEVFGLARRNNRACPLPAPWAAFYDLLPARTEGGRSFTAPPPVDRQSWRTMSTMQKRLRLRDQIEWADRTGVLQAAHDFLAGLPEEHWHHFA